MMFTDVVEVRVAAGPGPVAQPGHGHKVRHHTPPHHHHGPAHSQHPACPPDMLLLLLPCAAGWLVVVGRYIARNSHAAMVRWQFWTMAPIVLTGVQRCFRGYLGRLDARILKKLHHCAVRVVSSSSSQHTHRRCSIHQGRGSHLAG